MLLPVGYDNFRKIIDNKLDFVDKSLFIKEIFDDRATEVTVITRPRRFGKTLNLSMLHHFLASEVYRMPTKGLFEGLNISQCGDAYMQQQGKYPVVFITFKEVKDLDYGSAEESISKLISDVYAEHDYLLSSNKLTDPKKSFL